MLKRLFIACISIGISYTVTAQTVAPAVDFESKNVQNDHIQARLGVGQSLTISPVPLPASNAMLTVTMVNVEYYSYAVMNSSGQIVELENLSGRPDSDFIDLNGAVRPGLYVISFDTNAGKITRKFNVI